MPNRLRPNLTRVLHKASKLLGCVALACALIAAPLSAQIRAYTFRPAGAAQGLSQGTTTAFAQDAQGFIWVGTRGGLNRFDGEGYRVLRRDPHQANSLPENHVTALASDGDRLWIGFDSQFIASMDTRSGQFKRYEHDAGRRNERNASIRALLFNRGALWVADESSVMRMDPDSGTLEPVLPADPALQLPVIRLATDAGGQLWISRHDRLYRVEAGRANEVARLASPITAMTSAGKGQLWLGTALGLHRWNGTAAELTATAARLDADAPRMEIRDIAVAPDGALWLSQRNRGLIRYLPKSGHVLHVRRLYDFSGSLPEDVITPLFVDRGGILWVGGQYLGPARFDPSGDQFAYISLPGKDVSNGGPYAQSVRALLQARDGDVWLSTDERRLLRFRMTDPIQIDDFTPQLSSAPGVASPPLRIATMIEDRLGRIWAGTSEGLARLNPGDGRLQMVALAGEPIEQVRSLAVDAEGHLYLGRHNLPIVRYDPATGTVRRIGLDGDRQGIENAVHALLVARDGTLWGGGNGGLLQFKPGNGEIRRFRTQPRNDSALNSNTILSLLQDRQGRIWVGTLDGLDRIQRPGDENVVFEHPLGSLRLNKSFSIFSVLQSPRSDMLWMGTSDGLLKFDPGTGKSVRHGLEAGVQDLEFNVNARAALADGRMLMGGIRGLNLFDPEARPSPDSLQPLRLLEMQPGDQPACTFCTHLSAQGVQLPADQRSLRVRVARLDYGTAAPFRYRYRLEPSEKDWTDNDTQREIRYTRLPTGRSVLRIQATDSEGHWATDELRIPLEVDTPVWRSWPFILACVLGATALLGMLGWSLIQRRRSELKLNQATLERENRLNMALWGAGESFWDYDLKTHQLTVSYHPSEDGLERVTERVDIHPDDLPALLKRVRRYLVSDARGILSSQHRVRYAGRNWHWVGTRGRAVKWDEDGRVLVISGTARDVTERLAAEHAQRIAVEVFHNMAEALMVLDDNLRILTVNDAFCAMTGYPRESLSGQSIDLLFGSGGALEAAHMMRQRLVQEGHWEGELWHQHRDGHHLLCHVQATTVTQDGTALERADDHYVVVLGDVTEQRKVEQELRQLANYDPLTELPNRSLFNRRLAEAISRHRDGGMFAVMFLDLDRFKDINDSLGHAVGDQVLCATAQRLRGIIDANQLVARLGGDEFTVILERMTSVQEAYRVANDMLHGFSVPLDLENGLEFAITPSIGISLYPEDGTDAETLVRQADTAMYQAKAAGRQMYRRYQPDMDAQAVQRLRLGTLLRGAIDRNEISLDYQPRWCLETGRLTAFEALMRWHHPELGRIPPDEFIPLAEDTGMIHELGGWAANQAAQTLAEWDRLRLPRVNMAINVSSAQLLREDLPGFIARCADVRGIAPGRIELEITESILMDNPRRVSERLQRLRSIGIQVAIDDFGTGYSSLAYLRGLPLDTVKIDRAFVADVAHDHRDESIVVAIITLARSLGMRTVAEGVETEAQLELLRRHGCQEAQGYYLARPLDAAASRELLQAQQISLDPDQRP